MKHDDYFWIMWNSRFYLFVAVVVITSGSCNRKPVEWEFHYPGDNFTDEALLDLRYLNETHAGEHGFIGLSEDGGSFVRGDGQPIRFWPVNGGGSTASMSDADLEWHARFLAKQGVNMNRWHGSVNPAGKGTDIFEIDTVEVHSIWRWVAAMKKEGIYSTISPFWAHNGHMGGWIPEEWGIDGYSGKDELWEVMYFNDRLKSAYKRWVKYLYCEVNPYTGIALKDDPAVALIQIKNEDGVFWWTMQMVKPQLKQLVSARFAEFLTTKYGSLAKAMKAWGGASLPGDDLSGGEMDLYTIWDMTQSQEGAKARRLTDQTEFYAREQYSFYKEIYDFYRQNLGCQQLINPNNWKTADPARLNDLERWSYSSCEVPALNRYYAPGHAGENNGWRIDPGHHYTGISALLQPHKIPVTVKQVAGSPMIITESGWNLPNLYQSEAPALISAYQSLIGHDAYYWFYITSKDYMTFPYFEFTKDSAGMFAMNRWTYSTPGGIAQFPAYALMFRKGYIAEGETMIHEVRSMQDLWNRKIPLISEEVSFDPNRDQLEGVRTLSSKEGLTPLSFLTGPVEVTYGGDPGESMVHENLADLIDQENGVVRSITGELSLNYRKGLFTFNSPGAEGISGFAGGEGAISLDNVTIESHNDYVTVGVVSMDGLPLDISRNILIQAGTTYRPTGWKEVEDEFVLNGDSVEGFRIVDTGKMPWLAAPTQVRVLINNPELKKAWLLDLAGYPARELKMEKRGGGISVELPSDALYVVLKDQ